MKKLSLLILITVLFSCKEQNLEVKEAKLKILNPIIIFSNIPVNTKKTFYLYIENSGNKNLNITNIKPSCKCVVNKESHMVVEPQARDSIQLTISADAVGEYEETIVIFRFQAGI